MASPEGWFEVVGRWSLTKRLAVLISASLAMTTVNGSIGWGVGGRAGAMAAASAGGICLLAGLVSMVGAEPFRGPMYGLATLALGTIFRLGMALSLGIGVYKARPDWSKAGFIYFLIVAYLANLASETFLTVAVIAADDAKQG